MRSLLAAIGAVCVIATVGPFAQPAASLDPIAIIETFAKTGRADDRLESREAALAFADAWGKRLRLWIDQAPASEQQRRAQLQALTALELGRVGAVGLTEFDQTGFRGVLFDAAHALLRRGPSSEFERRWLVASTGLLVSLGGDGGGAVERHLDTAVARFPNDGRLRMNQRLMDRDVRTLAPQPGTSQGDLGFSLGHGDRSSARHAVGKAEKVFGALLDDPLVGAEAHARMGWLRFHQGSLTECLTLFAQAALSSDVFVRNLAGLGLGLTYQSLGRATEATAALTNAVRDLPAARTSTTALAAQLFLSGRREEASRLLDGLAGVANILDPWKHVAGADRFLDELLTEMKIELGVPVPIALQASTPEAARTPSQFSPVASASQPLAPTRRADFSAATSMVAVDVAAMANRQALQGLDIGDFEIRDNGVLQAIDSVSLEGLPLDVSVVLDLREVRYGARAGSGEFVRVSDATGQGVADATRVATLLRPGDRLRIVTATRDVAEPRPLQDSSGLAVQVIPREGLWSSALNDAIFTALARFTPKDRRHLVLVFTDGIDGASITRPDQLRRVAAMSDGLMIVFRRDTAQEFANPTGARIGGLSTQGHLLWPHDERNLVRVAEATGGSVERINSTGESVVADVKRTLDSFRQRYILRYKPTGVEPGGWHNLTVRVTRPGRVDVQARRGYFGG